MKKQVLGLVVCCFVLLMGQSALATGLGGGVWLGGGPASLESDNSDVDLHALQQGTGFLLDTSPISGPLFSYRLQIGYQETKLEENGDSIKLRGLSIDNTFAFAVVRTPDVRFWIGPLVHLGYQEGDYDVAGFGDNLDIRLSSFALGPEIGANFRFVGGFLGSVCAGAKIVGLSGEVEMSGNSEDIHGNERVVYIKFNLLGDVQSTL